MISGFHGQPTSTRLRLRNVYAQRKKGSEKCFGFFFELCDIVYFLCFVSFVLRLHMSVLSFWVKVFFVSNYSFCIPNLMEVKYRLINKLELLYVPFIF